MRKDKEFTFDKLKQSKEITTEDCQNLFEYAKVLYELEKYPCKCTKNLISMSLEAEKYLFNLKEILATETYSQSTLVSQVLWGLLACEILN
jgi:hypothetical protein